MAYSVNIGFRESSPIPGKSGIVMRLPVHVMSRKLAVRERRLENGSKLNEKQ